MSDLIVADFTTREHECVTLDAPCVPAVAPLPTRDAAEYMDGANDMTPPGEDPQPTWADWLDTAAIPLLALGGIVGILIGVAAGWIA